MQFGASPPSPVIAADIFRGGLLITFASEKCAFYSWALIGTIFDLAEEVRLPPDEEA